MTPAADSGSGSSRANRMQRAPVSVVVVGAGAIGGVTAAFMALSGGPVELVCTPAGFA